VIATFTLARSAGASFEEAAHLANHAGGLVVMKRGTATVGASELRHAISGGAIGRAAMDGP
jgi:bifunctional ADP-heptose synthase (sugar kinase/adenylyltransferase)